MGGLNEFAMVMVAERESATNELQRIAWDRIFDVSMLKIRFVFRHELAGSCMSLYQIAQFMLVIMLAIHA